MNDTRLAERIEQALVDMCRMQDKPKLPELWISSFPVSVDELARKSRGEVQAWFSKLSVVSKHGLAQAPRNSGGTPNGGYPFRGNSVLQH